MQLTVEEQKLIANFIGRIADKPPKAQHMYALSELKRIHHRKRADGSEYAPTTRRRLISEYRSAIRSVMGDNAPVLKYFRYSSERTQEYRDHQNAQRLVRHDNQRPLDADRHISAAVAVLEFNDLVTWSTESAIAGVIALTGRRPYEVACVGTMTPDPEDDNCILFAGQIKTRDDIRAGEAYSIPVLARRDLVLKTVARIREEIDPKLPNDVYSQRWGKLIGKASKAYFVDDDRRPILPRELREAYAAIAYHMFAPDKITGVRYYNRVLGHVEGDLNTTLFYFGFYIKDQPLPDPTVPWVEHTEAEPAE